MEKMLPDLLALGSAEHFLTVHAVRSILPALSCRLGRTGRRETIRTDGHGDRPRLEGFGACPLGGATEVNTRCQSSRWDSHYGLPDCPGTEVPGYLLCVPMGRTPSVQLAERTSRTAQPSPRPYGTHSRRSVVCHHAAERISRLTPGIRVLDRVGNVSKFTHHCE